MAKVRTFGDDKGGGATKEKALAEVELSSDDDGRGGSILSFIGSDDSDRELTQKGAIEAFHTSFPLHMAVRAIYDAVGEIDYFWQGDSDPDEFSLERPNRWHQSAEHFGLCAAYLKLGGEYFAIKNQTARGVELWPIPPHDVEEPESPSGKWMIEDGAVAGLSRNRFDRDELLIIQEPSLLDPFMEGRGSGQVVGHDIDIHEAAGEHIATYLENHARPDAILSGEGIDEEEFRRLADSLQGKHGGPGRSGQIEGMSSEIDIQTLTEPLENIGGPDLRRASSQICRQVFGVPPSVVGDVSDTNFATAKAEERIFKQNTVRPLVKKIVEAHQAQLVTPDLDGEHTLVTGQIVPSNTEHQLEFAKEHPGAVLVNEGREAVGLEARDELEGQTLADVKVPAPAGQRAGDPGAEKSGGAKKKVRSLSSSRSRPKSSSSGY